MASLNQLCRSRSPTQPEKEKTLPFNCFLPTFSFRCIFAEVELSLLPGKNSVFSFLRGLKITPQKNLKRLGGGGFLTFYWFPGCLFWGVVLCTEFIFFLLSKMLLNYSSKNPLSSMIERLWIPQRTHLIMFCMSSMEMKNCLQYQQ